ncbi:MULTISPECIES: cell division protein FtsL [unclassified Pusillimonas]|uniref:cell division protein FtsL n=1 Tax=unclassified Pusillimonas TaxID=2640016 RepID=UPI000B9CFF5B|nr:MULTISPECIES: cell division protein FtsL [unclassified Pusillimonas]OXR49029.1 cell division protein FtsL [Pusillimonas sp. T2]ROT45908.1 cell division protein FtsL [Pusillimonas sp. NJUB218]
MNRLSLLFAVVLMLSAISLVTARYQSRQLFIASERSTARTQELDIEWRRLQLERAELARNARVDELARHDLQMVVPRPVGTIYIKENRVVANPFMKSGAKP